MNKEKLRQLDVKIAKLLGKEVLGLAPCHFFSSEWDASVSTDETGKMHPVYLRRCDCDIKEPDDINVLGHFFGCLEVVEFYTTCHSSATKAMETIVDKLKAEVEITYFASEQAGKYSVGIFKFTHGSPGVFEFDAIGDAMTMPLAICRALVNLEASNTEKHHDPFTLEEME